MFAGFEERRVETSEAEVELRIGGSGPPVLLLHGYPQTHAMWHAVAPALAERFTVVAADLRGYGISLEARLGSRPRGVLEAVDGARSGRGDEGARVRVVRRGGA